jgi:hypothetical protein
MESKLKPTLRRIREVYSEIEGLNTKLKRTSSYGMQNSILKSLQLKKDNIRSLLKRVEKLTKGNIITITFRENSSGDTYRKIYTNISKEDASLHLRMVAGFQGVKITILEIKEVTTQDSWIKL